MRFSSLCECVFTVFSCDLTVWIGFKLFNVCSLCCCCCCCCNFIFIFISVSRVVPCSAFCFFLRATSSFILIASLFSPRITYGYKLSIQLCFLCSVLLVGTHLSLFFCYFNFGFFSFWPPSSPTHALLVFGLHVLSLLLVRRDGCFDFDVLVCVYFVVCTTRRRKTRVCALIGRSKDKTVYILGCYCSALSLWYFMRERLCEGKRREGRERDPLASICAQLGLFPHLYYACFLALLLLWL